ncbi:haloacid dehalogenase-like hydrolase domain-containing protein Sgpp [Typha angustifolia]|uniref:haloacid dehalogenase-like hydrolase domain-containing protein Sgpp n=1 Tax=Typha angustifolia TaxID=59011 RepID=UPI003C2C174B
MSISSNPQPLECFLSKLGPLEAILFDVDGTLCDSDPIHFFAVRELLQKIGFNDGIPITEEFSLKNMVGKNIEEIALALFPEWNHEKVMKFFDDKDSLFRRLAPEQLKEINGLSKFCKWIADRGLKRAAVTNSPRPNAELMISCVGLSDFFQEVVIGDECERSKPYPDPYLTALRRLKASPGHTLIFEDTATGIRAGVAAGMPVIGVVGRSSDKKSLIEAGAKFLIEDYEDPKLWIALQELDKGALNMSWKGSI